MDRIRFGVVIEAMHHLPYWAALQHGQYRDRGLDVEFTVCGSVEETTRALKSGEIDVCAGSPENVIQDVEAGGNLRMIGGNVNRLTHDLIVQPEIKSLADLRGKVVGVSTPTGGTSSLFIDVLRQAGLTQGEYRIVVAGVVPPRHAKLMAREIDAGMQTDPHNYIAEDAGLGNLGHVSQWIPYFIFSSINTRLDWAEAHGDALTHLLAASIQASQWMFADRAAACALAASWMNIDQGYTERAWDDLGELDAVPVDLHIKAASLRRTIENMRNDRQISIETDVLISKYLNLEYLAAAQKLLGLPANLLPDT